MKRYNTTAEVMLRFNFNLQATDEDAAASIANQRVSTWLRRNGLDANEIYGERTVYADEDEEN